jgi:proteasome component ECM29
LALGHSLISNPSKKHLELIIDIPTLLNKQVELFFSIGEAICSATFGFSSEHMDEFQDVSGVSKRKKLLEPLTGDEIKENIEKLLSLVDPSASAVSKKSASIWILCVVKYCGKHEIVISYLKRLHDAFSSLLGDKDGNMI